MNELFQTSLKSNNDKSEKKLRPCCACPETRELRDQCIFQKGEENCLKYIEDHKKCLKDLGFQV
jgi:cytochrome c oxidase assembly protein subunit 17